MLHVVNLMKHNKYIFNRNVVMYGILFITIVGTHTISLYSCISVYGQVSDTDVQKSSI